ncbi:MAG: hypothetical protein R3275_02560 [Saprospiraceae bacterium]|nr:hypothetical protein [Saprospiraceae bacterium]
MIIKELTLYSHRLQHQKDFYLDILGFLPVENSTKKFSIQAGRTLLTFKADKKPHHYHYCFLVPRNKLSLGLEWLSQRTELIEIEKGRYLQDYPAWNAQSIYFWDRSDNVAEFIAHHELSNDSDQLFDQSSLLCVNEIGMPTKDIPALNTQLEKHLNTSFWSGNFERFGTNGNAEGMFLLVNYDIKTTWFPTDLETRPEPFSATILQNGMEHTMKYQENEKVRFNSI